MGSRYSETMTRKTDPVVRVVSWLITSRSRRSFQAGSSGDRRRHPLGFRWQSSGRLLAICIGIVPINAADGCSSFVRRTPELTQSRLLIRLSTSGTVRVQPEDELKLSMNSPVRA